MKIIRLLFLLLPATAAFSQNYHPFIKYGVYRDEFWAPQLQICTFLYGSRFWFQGDSVLNGQVYHKLCSAGIQGDPDAPVFCPPYTVDTGACSIFALMREDTAAQQVFRYDFDTGTEYLLFDFSINAGDSVSVGFPPLACYVDSTGLETWNDGTSRRILYLNTPFGEMVKWVESFGNFNNLWNPLAPPCICPHGFCYEQNGENLYGWVCAKAVFTSEPGFDLSALKVQPNPADDHIIVQLQNETDGFDRVVVLNVLGKVVAEQLFAGTIASADVPVQQISRGIYTVLVLRQGKNVGLKRFVKQ